MFMRSIRGTPAVLRVRERRQCVVGRLGGGVSMETLARRWRQIRRPTFEILARLVMTFSSCPLVCGGRLDEHSIRRVSKHTILLLVKW